MQHQSIVLKKKGGDSLINLQHRNNETEKNQVKTFCCEKVHIINYFIIENSHHFHGKKNLLKIWDI